MIIKYICPQNAEKFKVVYPTNTANYTPQQHTNVVNFYLKMSASFFNWKTKQSHLKVCFDPQKEQDPNPTVTFIFNKSREYRNWNQFQQAVGHNDPSDFRNFLLLPFIEVHPRSALTQPVLIIKIENINWQILFNEFEHNNLQRTATLVIGPSMHPVFAAINKKKFVKIYFSRFDSLKKETAVSSVLKFCNNTLFAVVYTKRKNNISSGFRFVYLDDIAAATKLIKRTIPLRQPGTAITFNWAKKYKTGTGEEEEQEVDAQEDGGQRGRKGY